jgi:hypothetical protein
MTRLTTRTRALAATALIALLPATASAVPIVTNGGFETTDLTGWTGGSFVSANNDFADTGTYSVRMGCTAVSGCVTFGAGGVGGTGTLTQTLTLAPGIYRLTYAERIETGTPNEFAVSLGTNVLTHTVDAPAQVFTPVASVSAVSGGSTVLAFGAQHVPSYIRLDTIALTLIDDGQGNNIAAVSQSSAFQNTYGFLNRLQDRFGHAGSPVKVALNTPVEAASSTGAYISPTGKYRAYMSGYGDRSRWDGGDERGQRWGLNVGAEMAVASGLDIGASLSVGHSRFASDTLLTDNRGKADEYVGAIHGHFSPDSMPVYITAAGGYAYTSNDLSRTSILSPSLGTAIARDVAGKQWFASVELGYDWNAANGLVVTPFARADGARLKQDGYSEIVLSGGSMLPMTVASVDQDAARTILGARGTLDLSVGRRGAKLSASAGWGHEFERGRSVDFSTTSSTLLGLGTSVTFAGSTGAASPAANSVIAGAGVEAPISDEARIFVGYNGDFASGQNTHAGEVGLRVNW